MTVVPVLDGPGRVLWNRDRDRLPRVHHRDRALPHALTSGGLIERRNCGVGGYLRRRPRGGSCRYAWRRSEHPGRGLVGELHIPNELIFVIGTTSLMAASRTPGTGAAATWGGPGVTVSTEGEMPMSHII
jgi:hypothetical protein